MLLIVIVLTTTHSIAAKKKKEKDCIYCKKYEKMKDWPESERQAALIWEDVKYHEGMF